jgi:hypothetical protein
VARESPLDRSSSTRGVPARTDTRSSAKEEMPRATLWPSGMPRVDAPRLQNVSRTGGDSRGLQGTPGEGLGNKLRGGSSPIVGSRAPSPVMKMAGTGSTPASSTKSARSIYPPGHDPSSCPLVRAQRGEWARLIGRSTRGASSAGATMRVVRCDPAPVWSPTTVSRSPRPLLSPIWRTFRNLADRSGTR